MDRDFWDYLDTQPFVRCIPISSCMFIFKHDEFPFHLCSVQMTGISLYCVNSYWRFRVVLDYRLEPHMNYKINQCVFDSRVCTRTSILNGTTLIGLTSLDDNYSPTLGHTMVTKSLKIP